VLAARSIDTLRAEAERLTAGGATALAVPLDVTSDASVAAAVDEVLGRLGRIDAVVNNAGNAGRLSPWDRMDPAATRAMFDVHVFGMERVTRAVLPHMLARGSGTIVNIASTLAWVPMPMAAAYSAAKAAVLSFSESLRGELAGRGVDVVLVRAAAHADAVRDAAPGAARLHARMGGRGARAVAPAAGGPASSPGPRTGSSS
jgi:NADP-dependent 3-hydroxy acid dehydrogenase YdfG